MQASVSKIKLFKACRRAYYFKYVECMEPVNKAEALVVGSNYHKNIEELYLNGGVVIVDYSKEEAMAVAYQKYIYPILKVKSTEQWNHKKCGSHLMIGRIDGISEDGCIVEHKSTSMDITEEYEYNLQWDEQLLAYMYLTGTRRAYYTICRKPTIRQKKNESKEEFFDRMVAWYDEDTEHKIKALCIYRTDKEIEDFAKSFSWICNEIEFEEMMASQGNMDGLYRNTQYCNCWGRRCEYSSVCLNYDPKQEYIEFVKGEKHELEF